MEAIYNSQVSEAIDPFLEVAKMRIKGGEIFKCLSVHVFKY